MRTVVLLLVTSVVVAGAWWFMRDPLADLPLSGTPTTAAVANITHDGGRLLQQVTLTDAQLGTIGFTLSLPDATLARRLPVIVVLGGVGTGEHNIHAIRDIGDNAVLGYDWPLPTTFPRDASPLELMELRAQALCIPGQVATILRWVKAQNWSDGDRISIVGFSLGAIAAPAIERVAAMGNVSIGWTVFAFAGAPFGAVIEGDTRIHPTWARPIFALAAATLLRPLDPAVHLPYLGGHFLVLSADGDTIIPANASHRFEELTPRPKQLIRLAGDHVGVGPNRLATLDNAMRATRQWLAASGAINSTDVP